MYTIKNAKVLNDSFEFINADVCIDGNKIAQIAPDINEGEIIDASGKCVLPGFVSIHTHGAVGEYAVDSDYDAVNKVSKFWATNGTTTFVPTTSTRSFDEVKRAMGAIAEAIERGCDGAAVAGVNMEGPYLSEKGRGGHNVELMRTPAEFDFDELQKAARGNIKIVTLAPEIDGAVDFVKKYGDKVCVSLGHSGANYDEAKAAFDAGAKLVTHLFNGMPSIHHRNMGLIEAAFDSSASVEIITDGVHINKSMVLMAIKMFGYDRIVIINDSMQGTGLSDGVYNFKGMVRVIKNGVGVTEDGRINGGTATILKCVKNVVKWGVPLEMAVKMATYNPAAAIGMEDKIGSIAEGKDADIVIASDALEIKNVFVKGRKIEF